MKFTWMWLRLLISIFRYTWNSLSLFNRNFLEYDVNNYGIYGQIHVITRKFTSNLNFYTNIIYNNQISWLTIFLSDYSIKFNQEYRKTIPHLILIKVEGSYYKNNKNNGNYNDSQRYMNHELASGGYITSNIAAFPLEVLHFPIKVRVRDHDHWWITLLHKNIHWAINSGGPLYVQRSNM